MSDYIHMNKADKQAKAKEEYKRYMYDGDYRPDSYTNGSTYHKIRINDMEVKPSLAKGIDQMISLSKSALWNDVLVNLDKFMAKYHKLPAEAQIRTYPEQMKLYTQVGRDLKNLEYIQKNYTNKTPQPAQLINDENDKTTTVIDTDYFKDVESDVKIDFPYQSISEIMKNRELSVKERIAMCDRYLEIRNGDIVVDDFDIECPLKDAILNGKAEITLDDIETLDDDVLETPISMEVIKEYSMDIPETKKSPKHMFLILCERFPKRFVKAKKGKSPKVGWLKTIKGNDYTPTLITVNPEEADVYAKECLMDSTIQHKADSYFVKGLNAHMYFVRTFKE